MSFVVLFCGGLFCYFQTPRSQIFPKHFRKNAVRWKNGGQKDVLFCLCPPCFNPVDNLEMPFFEFCHGKKTKNMTSLDESYILRLLEPTSENDQISSSSIQALQQDNCLNTLFQNKNSVFQAQAGEFLFLCRFEAEIFLWLFLDCRENYVHLTTYSMEVSN